MFIVGLVSWWYTAGWWQQFGKFRERIARLSDYFSLSLLVTTLFAPFRQISVGRVNGSLGVQLRAWADRLISRFIGAIVRIGTLIAGVCVMIVQIVWGVGILVGWALVPILPIAGLIMVLIGWTPSWSI